MNPRTFPLYSWVTVELSIYDRACPLHWSAFICICIEINIAAWNFFHSTIDIRMKKEKLNWL